MTAVDTPTTSTASAPAAGTGPPRGRRVREALAGYGFLTPALLLFAAFVFVPLVWAVFISFQRTNGFGDGTWDGLANYRRLVSDGVFWRSAANTALFTVIVVPVSMAIGLALATLMNSVLPGRAVFRTILVLPLVVSGVATALIGVLVFDQNTGIANKVLGALGISEVPWQSGGPAAFASVVLVTLWSRVGLTMLVYLAGLQGVPAELHEAATLDGAGTWQRFRCVTLPLLGPSTFFLLVINVISSFQVFDTVFVLTEGGPGDATSVLVTYAYDNGFVTRDQGYAAAIGMVLLVITLVFAAVQWRASRRRDVTA